MDNVNGESSAVVRVWILEHACKHRMRKVVSAIMKQDTWKCVGCARDISKCINPMYLVHMLFMDLTDKLKLLLQGGLTLDTLRTIDREALVVIVNCLEALYLQKRFLPFMTFYKLLHAIKLLVMTICMVEGKDKEEISEQLDEIFPRFNKERYMQFAEHFGLTEQERTSHQGKEKEARLFVLQLLLKYGNQKNYPNQDLLSQAKALLNTMKDMVPEVVKLAIMPYVTDTFIERILSGSEKNIYTDSDPAVKLLLEFIRPDVSEDELLCALTVLDPSEDILPIIPQTAAASELTSAAVPVHGDDKNSLEFFDLAC